MSTPAQALTPDQPVSAPTAPSATVPMISPDGQIGDIPVDQADKASAAGFKHAVDMVSPDGKHGTIPTDQAEAAQKAGFRVAGATPKMLPSYTAMALENAPSGADPHNPGNPNLNAVPESERKSVNDSAFNTQASALAGEGLGALGKLATASRIPAGAVAEELAGGVKILRDSGTGQFVKAGPSLVGRIPGILKTTYDWATANPLKAYLVYKVAEEAGVGTSGLKKLFHIVSGAAE